MRSLFRRIIVQSFRYSYRSNPSGRSWWSPREHFIRGTLGAFIKAFYLDFTKTQSGSGRRTVSPLRREEDKGSFRLTARSQDGPKAPRLPSLGREIFFLHLSPPSATPPTYERTDIHPPTEVLSRFSFQTTTSFLTISTSTPIVTVTVKTFTLQARVPSDFAIATREPRHGVFDSADLGVSARYREGIKYTPACIWPSTEEAFDVRGKERETNRNFYPRAK